MSIRKSETPLLRFLRALTTDDRNEFAKAVGTTTVYLYQLAAAPVPNPKLRLALALVEQSAVFMKKIPRVMRVSPLTIDDLLVGAETIETAE